MSPLMPANGFINSGSESKCLYAETLLIIRGTDFHLLVQRLKKKRLKEVQDFCERLLAERGLSLFKCINPAGDNKMETDRTHA